MNFQFINTLKQIFANDSVTPLIGVIRQFDWFLIRLLKRFPRTEIISKSKLFVDRANGPASLVHIFGLYDYHNMNLIQHILRKDPNLWFIDVGANIGVYTLLAAETGVNVLAIEPHPITYESLVENIEINEYYKVITENCAATDRFSKLRFTDYQENAINRVQENGTIPVNGVPIDYLIAKHKIEKFILKIDTEGYDYKVLIGTKSNLDNCQLIIVEDDDPEIQRLLMNNNFYPGKYYNHKHQQYSSKSQLRREDLVFLRNFHNWQGDI